MFYLNQLKDWQDKVVFHPCPVNTFKTCVFHDRPPNSFSEIRISPEPNVLLHGVLFHKLTKTAQTQKDHNTYIDNGVTSTSNIRRFLVLLFHGNCNSVDEWGGVAKELNLRGYDVLITDYRQFGRSRGEMSEEALFSDAKTWWNYTIQQLQYSPNCISIHGISIGTAIAIRLAADVSSFACAQLVLETPFDQLYTLAQHHIGKLISLLGWALFKYEFNNIQFVPDLRCSVYMIHCKDDTIIPFASFQNLLDTMKKFHTLNYIRLSEYVGTNGNHNVRSSDVWPAFLNHAYPSVGIA